jgi:hypothetical protein
MLGDGRPAARLENLRRKAARDLDVGQCRYFIKPMATSDDPKGSAGPAPTSKPAEPKKPLTPAAERALAEAAERRAAAEHAAAGRPEEKGGRKGLDPTRYGDWEVKGIASDF